MLSLLWIIIPLCVLVLIGVVVYLVYAGDITLTHARHEASQKATLNAAVGLIGKTLQSISHDLLYLAREGRLAEAIATRDAAAMTALEQDWIAFSRSKSIYDKIRWLDADGQERVRINYSAAGPQAVPAERLQNRSLRYFFRDTMSLGPMEIYVSPFDLNVEGEAIEVPHKPTIRLGTPLFDADGRSQGVLLLNYLGEDLLGRIIHTLPEIGRHFFLLNSEGYWLYHPDEVERWGFMFNRGDLSLAARKPEVWARIMAERSGQFLTEDGLWTFDTVYPLLEGQKTSSGSGRLFSPSQGMQTAQPYFWKAVTLLPLDEYHTVNLQRVALAHRIGQRLFLLRRAWSDAGNALFGRGQRVLRERLAAQVVEHTPQGVMVTDAALCVQMVNVAFTRITGYSASESVGRPPAFLQSDEQSTEFYQALWSQVIKDQSWEGEVWCRRRNGELIAEWLSINALRDERGVVTHYICLFTDITRLKESAQRMEYFAHHDMLTGLANSRLLHARLEHSIQLAQRVKRQFAVLFIDLDNFKAVNDRFGHARGDELLREAAQRIAQSLRAGDTLARLGGDEFVVLLEDVGSAAEAQRVIDGVQQQFPCTVASDDCSVDVGASIGISFYPQDGTTAATLLGKADHAMYATKHHHRENRDAASQAAARGAG
ncbi:MAG: diguanylate cyclase [Rhodocyclaceae bacterium]|nr:diguanylate cyclase [Rhodocyclaceae bacterium]